MPAPASIIREANAVVLRNAPQLNAAQRQIALAIGNLENEYGTGKGWLKEDGTPSYNWGALTGSGTDGSIYHLDNRADGTQVKYSFKSFNSMDEGFQSFFKTWSRNDVSADKTYIDHEINALIPASRGDAYNVARTMFVHRYYEGTPTGAGAWHPSMGSDDERRVQSYAKAILGSAKTVSSAINEPLAVSLVIPESASTGMSNTTKISLIVAAAGFAGIAYYLYSGRRY